LGLARRGPQADREAEARIWAPVRAEQLRHGDPQLFVCLGGITERLLRAQRALLPPLPRVERVHHYHYVGTRPEGKRGPMHPDRVAEYHADLARVVATAR